MASQTLDRAVAIVKEIAEEIGFDCIGQVETTALVTRPEVRDMCAADKCQHYDKSWRCPPVCGPISEFQAQIDARSMAVLVQTVGQMEDSFDFEAIMEASEIQNERFGKLVFAVRDRLGDMNPFYLGSGTCTLCPECAYPDAPCRFPDQTYVSMEAGGLVVSEVCVAAGIPYNHGKNTIAYTGCVLL